MDALIIWVADQVCHTFSLLGVSMLRAYSCVTYENRFMLGTACGAVLIVTFVAMLLSGKEETRAK